MKNTNHKIKIDLQKGSRHSIEYFVEEVSDKLHINNTYFGNLLAGMNAVISIVSENQQDKPIVISYSTDYQIVNILVEDVSRETEKNIKKLIAGKDDENSQDMFTLFNVTESLEVDNGKITMVFDIGAMNRLEYDRRKHALETYFSGKLEEKSKKSNDPFYL